MIEADVKANIVAAMFNAGGYGRRVEDKYLVGTPDLILAHPLVGTVIAEAKMVLHNVFAPTPRQRVEMQRIDNGGGVAVLVGYKQSVDRYYLHKTPARGDNVNIIDCVHSARFVEALIEWRRLNER